MPTVTCKHHEIITIEGELERGECRYCHQVKMYDKHGPKPTVTITKLGRNNGQIVLPDCQTLSLTPEENEELIAAINSENNKKEPASPQEKKKGGPRIQQPGQYFDDHKAEVLKDYNKLTTVKFLSLWHLSSMRWKKIKLRWGLGGKHAYPLKAKFIPHTVNTLLPQFPEFNEDWDVPVKAKWLETYVELKKLEGAGPTHE